MSICNEGPVIESFPGPLMTRGRGIMGMASRRGHLVCLDRSYLHGDEWSLHGFNFPAPVPASLISNGRKKPRQDSRISIRRETIRRLEVQHHALVFPSC